MKNNGIIISKEKARNFILKYQGLDGKKQFVGKQGILDYIKRVGCIQFDPLNIAGHNHELVLQSRIPGFKPGMLKELLYKDRKLVDAWDKNMAIYCVEDWPYFSRNRISAKESLGHESRPAMQFVEEVRKEFVERGPLSSGDIDYDQTVNWSWAPTRLSRAVLESMYFWGELIVYNKVHTRKIYDLASRHITQELLEAPDPNKTDEEFHDWYILRRIGSTGILWNRPGDVWLGIGGFKSAERNAGFKRLLDNNKIIKVMIDGINEPFYIRDEDIDLLDSISNDGLSSMDSSIIAPLDNLIWDRRLILELFGFEYRWEVYKPEAERKYGYYVLPVLYGDRFVARFEPGRDKKKETLIIKNWWWEPEVKLTKDMAASLEKSLKSFIDFLGCRRIDIDGKALEKLGPLQKKA